MNLVIDAGNTRTKIGIFEGAALVGVRVFGQVDEARDFLRAQDAEHQLVSAVTGEGKSLQDLAHVKGQRLFLSPALPLPIRNRYETPQTLGADRLAAACGAWQMFPGQSSLVIDCGTCINYEFIHSGGSYEGGVISPGASMRFKAMHEMTDQLPLVEPVDEVPLTGRQTVHCMQSGVMNGILEEIKGIMGRYDEVNPGIRVILTGGDAHFFEKPLKPSIFVAPELILTGLHSILRYNVNA